MRNTLSVIALLMSSFLNAQEIKGILIDETNNQPIDGGFITLLSYPQKTFITSTYTETNGQFNIQGLANDSTVISISALGYKDSLISLPPLKENFSLGKIALSLRKTQYFNTMRKDNVTMLKIKWL